MHTALSLLLLACAAPLPPARATQVGACVEAEPSPSGLFRVPDTEGCWRLPPPTHTSLRLSFSTENANSTVHLTADGTGHVLEASLFAGAGAGGSRRPTEQFYLYADEHWSWTAGEDHGRAWIELFSASTWHPGLGRVELRLAPARDLEPSEFEAVLRFWRACALPGVSPPYGLRDLVVDAEGHLRLLDLHDFGLACPASRVAELVAALPELRTLYLAHNDLSPPPQPGDGLAPSAA